MVASTINNHYFVLKRVPNETIRKVAYELILYKRWENNPKKHYLLKSYEHN